MTDRTITLRNSNRGGVISAYVGEWWYAVVQKKAGWRITVACPSEEAAINKARMGHFSKSDDGEARLVTEQIWGWDDA